jgi:hypothetical protein
VNVIEQTIFSHLILEFLKTAQIGEMYMAGRFEILRLAKHIKIGASLTLLWVIAVQVCLLGSVFAEEKAANQTFSFKLLLSDKKSQIAIWLTNEKGTRVDTVYVTRKIAQKGLGNRGGSLDDKWGGSRLSTLPVWAYSRGIDYGSGNFYPPEGKPLSDAISSATPKAGEFIWNWNPKDVLKHGRYFYYVEVNKSFDQNDHHNYSWYRGQPSVVWRGSLLVGNEVNESEAQIIGHGHVAGENGQINPDLTTLTTSLSLIEKVTASYQP